MMPLFLFTGGLYSYPLVVGKVLHLGRGLVTVNGSLTATSRLVFETRRITVRFILSATG